MGSRRRRLKIHFDTPPLYLIVFSRISAIGFAEYFAKMEIEEAAFAYDVGQRHCHALPPFVTSRVETYRVVGNQVALAVFLVCASAAVIVVEVPVFFLLDSLDDFIKIDIVDG